jgi:hypothetical protein
MAVAERRIASGSRGRRAFAVGGALAASALGGVALVERLASGFDLRPEVTALFGAAGFFLGLVADRFRVVRNREATLARLLRHWPLTVLRKTDSHELGVFPPLAVAPRDDEAVEGDSHEAGGAGPYIAREIDGALREALGSEHFVIVFGAPNAGKSRTAFEAAKRVFGERAVVIPEDAEALAELSALEPPLPRREPSVLWLDGLERFLEVLTGDALDRLASMDPPMTVVGTIREGQYREALSGYDAVTYASRRLLCAARGFYLSDKLSQAQLSRARELYPAADFSKPVGEALGAKWSQGHAPLPTHEERDGALLVAGRFGLLRDLKLFIPAVLALISLGTLAALAAAGPFLKERPNIDREVQLVKSQGTGAQPGAPAGRFVDTARRLDLRGSGNDSYLFVFRDKDLEAVGAESDTLQIYDIEGDKLVPKLDFQPRGPTLYTFEVRGAADLNGDQTKEVIGGWVPASEGSLKPTRGAFRQMPVVTSQDEQGGTYAQHPLFTEPADLQAVSAPGRGARLVRRLYRTPVEVGDGKTTLKGYSAEEIALFRPGEDARLVAGFVARADRIGSPKLLDVQAWSFASKEAELSLGQKCVVFEGEQPFPAFVAPVKNLSLEKLLLGRWEVFEKQAIC